MIWRAGDRVWEFPRSPLIMGIVNVTPDSFSDGGQHATPEAAVAHALSLAAEGGDILGSGGESARPGAPTNDQQPTTSTLQHYTKLTAWPALRWERFGR